MKLTEEVCPVDSAPDDGTRHSLARITVKHLPGSKLYVELIDTLGVAIHIVGPVRIDEGATLTLDLPK